MGINERLTAVLFFAFFIVSLTGIIFRLIQNSSSSAKDYTFSGFDSNLLQNINLLDLAFVSKNMIKPEDIAALVVAWAEKGFLLIKSNEVNKGNYEIYISKIKDISEDSSPFEKAIFSELLQKPVHKTIEPLKFDNSRLNEKAQSLKNATNWIKLNIYNLESNKKFSKLIEDINNQKKQSAYENKTAIWKKFTFLELFICCSSIVMLGFAGLIFTQASKNDPAEFYVMGAMGILCAVFLFGGLYYLGKNWSFKTILGVLGLGYLIYLSAISYQTKYLETGNLFFENSHRYAGFIFGSILAFLAPKSKSLTIYGKTIKNLLKNEQKKLCSSSFESETFFKLLPKLIIFNCFEKSATQTPISKPDWYLGRNESNQFEVNTFLEDINCLRQVLKNLALKKR